MGELKFIDLSAGSGLPYCIGILWHHCEFSSDSDKDAQHTYSVNFNEFLWGYYQDRIFPDSCTSGYLWGFPCQPSVFQKSGRVS